MRLLHVTPFYEPLSAYGGMVRSVSALCRELAARGHEVTVATALLGSGLPGTETVGGVRVRRFPGPAPLDRVLMPWAWGLRGFLRSELATTDICHLHGLRSGLTTAAYRVLEAERRPWVLTPHGSYPHHGQFQAAKRLYDVAIGLRLVERAPQVLAVSASEARDLPRPACVIPNGVRSCGTAVSGQAWRERPRLLFVGTDRPQKRGHILPHLLDRLPQPELHLVGRFGRAFCDRLSRHSNRVHVAGVLDGDALAQAYADADILVHPAVGEAFGLVPFEAALAGTAAIVAGGHGCGEWYARAGGAVVPPDDVDALAAAVRMRIENRRAAEEEATAVAQYVRCELTWERCAAATEAVYHGIREAAR